MQVQEYMKYSQFLSSLLCLATKADPAIELRFILRQFNRRLRMDQLQQIIEKAQTNSQEAVLLLMTMLASKMPPTKLVEDKRLKKNNH
ncbi:MAG: hypothetical protein EZS28_037478 [Streblomastix strix]|uniref:Uncharacterized protein n=1 Tax=Streblomastix strix TaxID=222440 RepID=A0A5J4U9T4_9EUKA|nr:MAG: hypothetical protein EZS28_037478 [Streblomastix strix]